MNRDKLLASIQRAEGFSALPYDDRGDISIGYGRNLTRNPLTPQEGVYLMQRPFEAAIDSAPTTVKNYATLTDAQQNVLVEMVYNLGLGGVLKFKKMRAAIESGDFNLAAVEMMDSAWAKQVGSRALKLAEQMRDGTFA